MTAGKAIERYEKLIEEANELSFADLKVGEPGAAQDSFARVNAWAARVKGDISTVFGKGSAPRVLANQATSFFGSAFRRDGEDAFNAAKALFIQALEAAIQDIKDGMHVATINDDPTPVVVSNKVFIVHGHDGHAQEMVARFVEKLELDAVILHEQPSEGSTIIEKIEQNSDVSFALVLLTPDDVGAAREDVEMITQGASDLLKNRARQNVVLELGYFMGKLGRKKICALYAGVELPSDIQGLVYISLDEAGAWRLALARELKAAGLEIDMNNAL